MVAMLLALALGALTVGLGFKNQITQLTNEVSNYDLVLNQSELIDQSKVAKLSPTINAVYQQKEDEKTVYYNYSEFEQNPFLIMENQTPNTGERNVKTKQPQKN